MAQFGKKTLLEMVQDILSDMDSFEVNSIDDTPESLQIAGIVRDTYYEISANKNWTDKKTLFQLDGFAQSFRPTHFSIPTEIKEIIWLRYDTQDLDDEGRRRVKFIKYLHPDEFIMELEGRDNTDDDLYTTVDDPTGIKLTIRTDQAPRYWTSFDDKNIVMDSYDSEYSDTLLGEQTECYGVKTVEWLMEDDYVPELPHEAFSLLQAEATSYAFLVFKGMANEKAEQRARRQKTWLSRKDWTAKGGVRYADYGRKGRGRGRSPYLDKTQTVKFD